jgi:hypothetical protein
MSYYGEYERDPIYAKAKGSKILRVEANEDQVTIFTDRGILELTCEGDCCSRSFFYGMEEFKPEGKITGIEEVEANPGYVETIDASKHEVLRIEFLRVTTDKGSEFLTMYNDSNGYYGGWFVPRWIPE